ncbi:MAG: nucleotide exchange factor GrpE, partial [Bacteroidota bacterium]|nr:nucleotide exchange factor GrpE [Bacteroidota bacterium]
MSEKEKSQEQDEVRQTVSDVPAAETQEAESVELDVLRTEVATLKEQVLRKVAEFENYKRRTREEKDALLKYGAEGVISELLPVIDDFERSLAAGREHQDFVSFFSGVEIIYGKLLRVLQNRGLTPIEAVGKPFDVDYHDALLQVPSAENEPGTVLDEAEKGYMLHDKVLRHAKVTVSREVD